MTREEVISGLQMTMDLFLFDPATGEILTPDMLNDTDRVTYDACKGAIEALKAQIDKDTNVPSNDTISRQAATGIVLFECGEFVGLAKTIIKRFEELPSAQPAIMPDGTLTVTVDTDIANIGRILLSQTGTQYGGLYYKDAQPEPSRVARDIATIIENEQDMRVILQNERKTEKWIPCSERLPEEDGCYLVTTTGTNNDIIDIAYYTTGLWHKASRIKAWMPLPEPYLEER